MIVSTTDSERGEERLVLRPNASATRREALILFSAVALISLVIASAFAYVGAWLVLPFSGGELAVLAGCLVWSLRRNHRREVITITEAAICIERLGVDSAAERFEFPRLWARVDLAAAAFKGHPSRLSIRSHGKAIEIGQFLVESERIRLARRLKQLLA